MEGQGDDTSSEEEVDDSKLLDEAEAVLKDLNSDANQPATGVFQYVKRVSVTNRMAFMKRALEKQREEARLEAERLIQALREEEEFDEDTKEESPREESAQAAKIREALSSGRVRRDKQKTKSLSVTENIKVTPLFEAPNVPSLFGDVEGETEGVEGETGDVEGEIEGMEGEIGDVETEKTDDVKGEKLGPASHLLDELESEGTVGEDAELLEDTQEKTVSKDDSENPWLTVTADSVSRSSTRKEVSQSDDIVDITGTMARLEARAATRKDEKRGEKREAPKVVIIDSKSKKTSKEPIKGVLGMEELTQEELMTRAFGDEETEKEFAEQKAAAEAEEIEAYKKEHGIKETPMLEGWGSWAGIGAPEPKRRFVPKEPKIELPERSDAHLKHVIINQNEDKKSEMYRIQGVPYPFTSREQYERAMRQPLGREWNADQSFRNLTRPEVKTRLGTIIDPIKKPTRKPERKF